MKRLFAVAAAGVAGVALLSLAAGWLLAHPVQERIGPAPPDLAARSVTFPSESGTTVHAWWCPVEHSPGTVVLLPGIRANRLSMVGRARFLRKRGYSVLLPDLQATGETSGSEITFGWREREDVMAAVSFARLNAPTPVAVLGTSLGGAAALLALPDLRADTLIVESVYPTIERATRNRLQSRIGPLASLGVPLLLLQLEPRIGVTPSQLRPVDHIGQAHCPIFILGGADDRYTTVEDTMLLYRNARPPKQLWLVPGAAHVDLHHAAAAEYERRVGAFLDAMFRQRRH